MLLRHVGRRFRGGGIGNVARAVGEDIDGREADDALRAWELPDQRIIERHVGVAVGAEALRLVAHSDEEQPDGGMRGDVAKALEHAVAVIVWPDQQVRRDDADEAWRATLEGAIRLTIRRAGGEEEELQRLDESLVVVGEFGMAQAFDETVH